MPRPKRPPSPFRHFNFLAGVIQLLVMMYVRFPLNLRNVEALLAERRVDQEGEILVTNPRDNAAALKLMKRAAQAPHRSPETITMDCLRPNKARLKIPPRATSMTKERPFGLKRTVSERFASRV